MRRPALRAVSALALLGASMATTPTHADDTGISGSVESIVELTLERAAPGVVRATATATIPGTALTVSDPGAPARALGHYPLPVLRATARATTRRTGTTVLTITFGPRTP